MPFRSQAQRAYLYIHHPEIAKRWESETPKGEKLPEHVDEDTHRMALRARMKKAPHPHE